MKPDYHFKAGRLVGLADCYAVIALADNATFLLAVSRIAAIWSHSAIMHKITISSYGSAGRASAPKSWGRGFESHLGQVFSHVCAHFGIHGRCGNILSRLRLRGQLQYRTALHVIIAYNDELRLLIKSDKCNSHQMLSCNVGTPFHNHTASTVNFECFHAHSNVNWLIEARSKAAMMSVRMPTTRKYFFKEFLFDTLDIYLMQSATGIFWGNVQGDIHFSFTVLLYQNLVQSPPTCNFGVC